MTDTEREALCARIDELCAELGRSQLDLDMWHDRAEDMRNRLSVAQSENAKLCAEVERLHADQAHWELGNCPQCPNIVSLQEKMDENDKLRELCHDLRKEYAYLRARPRRFYVQHEARMAAIDARMSELGIEVDDG